MLILANKFVSYFARKKIVSYLFVPLQRNNKMELLTSNQTDMEQFHP